MKKYTSISSVTFVLVALLIVVNPAHAEVRYLDISSSVNTTVSTTSVVNVNASTSADVHANDGDNDSDSRSNGNMKNDSDNDNSTDVDVTSTSKDNSTVVASDDSHVEVNYKLPAKFLGIFKTEINSTTDVTFDQNSAGNGPKEVTVRYPWYRIFFSLSSDARANILESAVKSEVVVTNSSSTAATDVTVRNKRTVNLISSILKGIRANIEAKGSASAQ